jgi:hypothetical protein
MEQKYSLKGGNPKSLKAMKTNQPTVSTVGGFLIP